jgi:hypothetical protein
MSECACGHNREAHRSLRTGDVNCCKACNCSFFIPKTKPTLSCLFRPFQGTRAELVEHSAKCEAHPLWTYDWLKAGQIITRLESDLSAARAELAEANEKIRGYRNVCCAYCNHKTMAGDMTDAEINELVKAHIVECKDRPEARMLTVISIIGDALGVTWEGITENSPHEVANRMTSAIASLRLELAEARKDSARLDWLEGEMDREVACRGTRLPRSLFRTNMPITRTAIDAALSPSAEPGGKEVGG